MPSKFSRKAPTPSYLVKWDCTKWLPQLSQAAGIEPLTQMAIRYSCQRSNLPTPIHVCNLRIWFYLKSCTCVCHLTATVYFMVVFFHPLREQFSYNWPLISFIYWFDFFLSGNGIFVGVGTAEGDISVYIAWNLAVSIMWILINELGFV